MIGVLLVDDQSLIRAAVRSIVDGIPDVEVLGEASDGATAVRLARELRPDVVLMDIQMPGTDGIEATRLICADPELSAVRVLILTTFEDDSNVVMALRAGASGFIGKGLSLHSSWMRSALFDTGRRCCRPRQPGDSSGAT